MKKHIQKLYQHQRERGNPCIEPAKLELDQIAYNHIKITL